MPHDALTRAQRELLATACTVGLHKNPAGQARTPPYSRIALNVLIDKGLISPDWQPTPRGRAAHQAPQPA